MLAQRLLPLAVGHKFKANRMRQTLITIIFSFTLIPFVSGQSIIGKYHDYFGSKLHLDSDSTFTYTWNFDLSSSWSKGKWSVLNDTVYLNYVPIYDSVTYFDSTLNRQVDTLILSSDINSERISLNEFIGNVISGGGQNRKPCPNKLYYMRNRLYAIGWNGKLEKKRVFSTLRQKKYKPYYIKY